MFSYLGENIKLYKIEKIETWNTIRKVSGVNGILTNKRIDYSKKNHTLYPHSDKFSITNAMNFLLYCFHYLLQQ